MRIAHSACYPAAAVPDARCGARANVLPTGDFEHTFTPQVVKWKVQRAVHFLAARTAPSHTSRRTHPVAPALPRAVARVGPCAQVGVRGAACPCSYPAGRSALSGARADVGVPTWARPAPASGRRRPADSEFRCVGPFQTERRDRYWLDPVAAGKAARGQRAREGSGPTDNLLRTPGATWGRCARRSGPYLVRSAWSAKCPARTPLACGFPLLEGCMEKLPAAEAATAVRMARSTRMPTAAPAPA